MGKTTHRFVVHEARRMSHPALPQVEKHWFTVPAAEFPAGISTKANARDPVGLNKRVYRDVKESLLGNTASLGTFDMMNKGITILADSVRLMDKEKGIYAVVVDEEMGIVDGAHTAKLIEEAQNDGTIPKEQHVEVYIRTGVNTDLISDIAKGLNTGMQVKSQSIFNIDGAFDWLKDTVKGTKYETLISWKESDEGDYDVRDLISVLELFNVFDYPNDSGKHPLQAYEKWSAPLEKFGQDYKDNYQGNDPKRSKYYRLKGILKDALWLHDVIRSQFRAIHNSNGGQAGKLNIVEEASARRGKFKFPFAEVPPQTYRLTKGALYPILGAFRNCVEVHPKTGLAQWRDNFESVLALWESVGPELVRETFQATREIGTTPNAIGKSRNHWANLHKTLELRMLRGELARKKK